MEKSMLDKQEQKNILREIKDIIKKNDRKTMENIIYYGEMTTDMIWKSVYYMFNYNQIMKLLAKKIRAVDFMQLVYERRLFQTYFLYKELGYTDRAEKIKQKIKNLNKEIKQIKSEIMSLRTQLREMYSEHKEKIDAIMTEIEEETRKELGEQQEPEDEKEIEFDEEVFGLEELEVNKNEL